MDEIDQLRHTSASLLTKAQDASLPELAVAIERAADVQRLVADLERAGIEKRKLELEEQNLREANATAAKREKSDRIQDYVRIMTPVVTIVALAATLSFQAYQFVESEKSKRDAAEDAQWAEAVKTISQTSNLSPGVIALNPFLKSAKYGDEARATAVQLLANTSDAVFFNDLYGAAFVPIDWKNLDHVIRLARALTARGSRVWQKSWDSQKQINDFGRLDPKEVALYMHLDEVIPRVSAQVGSLLKGSRPSGTPAPDLSAARFKDTDWEDVNLSGATLDSASFSSLSLKGANLDQVTKFEGIYFYGVAWWEAARIGAPLLAHLEQSFPYDPNARYGHDLLTVAHDDYVTALERLKAQTP